MMHFGVMGKAVQQSLSPLLHQAFSKRIQRVIQYDRYSIQSDFVRHVFDFFSAGGSGLNVTAPYKREAFFASHRQTERAARSQSANTLWMKDEELWADMTDGIGLNRALWRYVDLTHARILILGAGGVVWGILPTLLDVAAEVGILNRTLAKARVLKSTFQSIKICSYEAPSKEYDIILNASGLDLDVSKLDPLWVRKKPFCMDLSYGPSGCTPFTEWANAQGCRAEDGYGMLVEQALEAFNGWHQTALTVDDFLGSHILNRYRFPK